MKTPQRKFVVEFKSRRRSSVATPRSIWENVDLKAVSASVAEDITLSPKVSEEDVEASSTTPANTEPDASLTQLSRMPESGASQQERVMADETNESVNPETSTGQTTAPLAEPKKQRAARGSKTTTANTTDEITSDPSAPAATSKRVKTTRTKKAKLTAANAKPVRNTRNPRTPGAISDAVPASVTASDDLTDLLQLEEENQQLRKQLAEKLRAENADLRKRLGIP